MKLMVCTLYTQYVEPFHFCFDDIYTSRVDLFGLTFAVVHEPFGSESWDRGYCHDRAGAISIGYAVDMIYGNLYSQLEMGPTAHDLT